MTSINKQVDYGYISNALDLLIQLALKEIYTSMPGIVVQYDRITRRAEIQPAIDTMLTNNMGSLPKPPVADVPIITPTAGNYLMTLPMRQGDPVTMLFSQRGIGKFKQAYRQSPPDDLVILGLRDAVAVPGFGPIEYQPAPDAKETSMVLQSLDGTRSIELGDEIVITHNRTKITLTRAGEVVITATGNVATYAQQEWLLEATEDALIHSVGQTRIQGDAGLSLQSGVAVRIEAADDIYIAANGDMAFTGSVVAIRGNQVGLYDDTGPLLNGRDILAEHDALRVAFETHGPHTTPP